MQQLANTDLATSPDSTRRVKISPRQHSNHGAGPPSGPDSGVLAGTEARHDAQPQGSGGLAQAIPASPSGEPRRPGSPGATLGLSPARQRSAPTSGNHLLNFTSEYRGRGQPAGRGRPPLQGRGSGRSRPARRYDRNAFLLQANYRFLVSDAIDVMSYERDPDRMLDWEDVIRVEVLQERSTAPLVCPITLDTPRCPQMTPCGHIFDGIAIISHIVEQGGMHFRRSSPCPLCFAPVVARELRLATLRPFTAPAAGSPMTFTLLRRRRDCVTPQLVAPGAGGPSLTGFACNPFAKFTTVADPTALWVQTAEELAKYSEQCTAEGGQDAAFEMPNVLAAMDALAGRARAWVEHRAQVLLQRADAPVHGVGQSPMEAGQSAAALVKAATSAAIAKAAEERHQHSQAEALEAEFPALSCSPQAAMPSWGKASQGAAPSTAGRGEGHRRGADGNSGSAPIDFPGPAAGAASVESTAILSTSAQSRGLLGSSPGDAGPAGMGSPDEYYFYQAADGQLCFLSALNLRMLVQRYGSYAACPPTLTARVLEVEDEVQTDVTRRRMRLLSHLPLTATFKLCEVDLTEVMENQMAPFAEEVALRQRKREQRAKQAARHAKREAAQEAAAAAASVGPSAAELKAMPVLGGPPAGELPHSLASTESETGAMEEEGTSEPQPVGIISFARIAKLGFAATGPAIGATSSDPPPVGASSGPRITAAAAVPEGVWRARKNAEPTSAIPIQAAPTAGTGGKGKKGGKQTLLFTTTQRRY